MRLKLIHIFLVLAVHSFAQETTTTLDSVDVVAVRILRHDKLITQELLKVNPQLNYAELLQLQGGLYIRSQGRGVLNTLSYKGIGNANIATSINGFKLQSSMNGTFDLSLLAGFHFSGAQIKEGEAKYSGAQFLGPQLDVNTQFNFNGQRLFIGGGSAIELQGGYGVQHIFGRNSTREVQYSLTMTGTSSKNRHALKPYGDTAYLSNTAYSGLSALQYIKTRVGSKGSLKSTAFIQYADRQIPSSLTAESKSQQEDLNFLLGNSYRWFNRRHLLQIEQQIWREQILFKDPSKGLRTLSRAWNVNTSLNYSYHQQHIQAGVGLANERSIYHSNAIQGTHYWDRYRIHQHVQFSPEQWKFQIDLQEQLLDRGMVNSWDVAVGRSLGNYTLKMQALKRYRLPTLNELFWNEPGLAVGNTDLQAEEGYRLEAYLYYTKKALDLTINPFLGKYKNLINWQGFPVIQAVNVKSVLTRGLEIKIRKRFELNSGFWYLDNNHHLVRSTYNEEDQALFPFGKQLIYMPVYSANLSVGFNRKQLGAYVNQQWVSKVHTSRDNSTSLNPYYVLEIGGYWEIQRFRWALRVNNLLNQPYFTVANRPMPGINGTINLQYHIRP